MSGFSEDFVHFHEGKTLSEAIEIIHSPETVGVHVFWDVIPNAFEDVDVKVKEIVAAHQPDLPIIRLKPTQLDGLYINPKIKAMVNADTAVDSILSSKPCDTLPHNVQEMEALYDSTIEKVAAGAISPVCAIKLTRDSSVAQTRLDGIPLHINPVRNPDIDASLGIDVPMLYLSGRGTFTELHTENGHLDSCNLIHWGEPRGVKLWLCIHPKHFSRIAKELSTAFAQLKTHGVDDVSSWRNGCCSAPHFHNNVMLTTQFLRSRNIFYQVIAQRAGDMIYSGTGVLRQVVNLGVCLAETVRVGESAWNLTGGLFVSCGCDACAVNAVSTNFHSESLVYDPPRKVNNYVFPGDTSVAKDVAEDKDHSALVFHEYTPEPTEKHICVYCGLRFVHKKSLNKHRNIVHLRLGFETCFWCLDLKSPDNIRRHQESCYNLSMKRVIGDLDNYFDIDPWSLFSESGQISKAKYKY